MSKEEVMYIYRKGDFSSLHAAPARYAPHVVGGGHETLNFFCYGSEIEARIKRIESQLSIIKCAVAEHELKEKKATTAIRKLKGDGA